MTKVFVRPNGFLAGKLANPVPFLLGFATRAEQLGFEGCFVGERLAASVNAADGDQAVYRETMLEPFPLLGAMAACTTTLRLGTLVAIPAIHHPLRLAKLTATLDLISNGRFIFGVGAGWSEAEFNALGIARAERGRRLDESIRIIRRLWSGESVTSDGPYYPLSDFSLRPLPVQPNGPEIWFGTFSPDTAGKRWDQLGEIPPDIARVLARVGELGDAWVPLLYSSAARDQLNATVLARAWETVQHRAEQAGRRDQVRMVCSTWVHLLESDEDQRRLEEALAFFPGTRQEADRTYLIGSPASIVERLARQMSGVDVADYVITPLSTDLDQLDRIASTIRPLLVS